MKTKDILCYGNYFHHCIVKNCFFFLSFQEWELLVLSRLKWDLSAITPHDFLEQILSRLPVEKQKAQIIKRHAQTFISLSATDFSLAVFAPSVIAAGSVGAATNGLLGPEWAHKVHLQLRLHIITGIETDWLCYCQEQIEQTLKRNLLQANSCSMTTRPMTRSSLNKDQEGSQAGKHCGFSVSGHTVTTSNFVTHIEVR